MMPRQALRLAAILSFALLVFLLSCSGDESVTGPDSEGPGTLNARYWPLPAGDAIWSYVRLESGVYSPDTLIDYYIPDLPAALTTMELPAGTIDVDGRPARRLLCATDEYLNGSIDLALELWLDDTAQGIELLGEDQSSAVDSSYVFMAHVPYDWIRFGESRWVAFEVDYSSDSMAIDAAYGYGEDAKGKVLLEDALGFDYPRIIYDGSNIPGNFPFDLSDVDHDTYPDGIAGLRLVGEVIDAVDFSISELESQLGASFWPDQAMADTLDMGDHYVVLEDVFRNCKWVRFSFEADLFLSNQRDPNAEAGQTSINETYVREQARFAPGRLDLGLLLLAPDLGPVAIVNYVDMDKQLVVSDPEAIVEVFSPDRVQIDYLWFSSLLAED